MVKSAHPPPFRFGSCSVAKSPQSENKDRVLAGQHEGALIGVVCDGVSSATRAAEGALHFAYYFHDALRDYYSKRVHALKDRPVPSREEWRGFLERAQKALEADVVHLEGEYEPSEFHTTVQAFIWAEEELAVFQVGDGSVLVSTEEFPQDFQMPYPPQEGGDGGGARRTSKTFSALDPKMLDRFNLRYIRRPISSLFMFTDGVDPLFVTYSQEAVAPNLENAQKLQEWIYQLDASDGATTNISQKLAEFFEKGGPYHKVTHDDKSLIVAVRAI